MGDIISFDPSKRKDEKEPEPEVSPEDIEKEKRKVRHNKAMNYIAWINSLHLHKFSYPTLACRYPKSTHSIDVLQGHCFTNWGAIQNDMKKYPSIAFAKQMAYERQGEIREFLRWRISKYQESKALYGNDLVVIDLHIEITETLSKLFEELFTSYVRT